MQGITYNNISFIAGCVMILLFAAIQLIFTFIGINIYNTRIHFESMIIALTDRFGPQFFHGYPINLVYLGQMG